MPKELRLVFEDDEYRQLTNNKEEKKIIGEVAGWEEYFLLIAGVKNTRIKRRTNEIRKVHTFSNHDKEVN